MRKHFVRLVLMCACLLGTGGVSSGVLAQQQPNHATPGTAPIDQLVFHSEEFPPFHYTAPDGKTEGWVITLLDGILRTAGAATMAQDTFIQPWARSYNVALTTPNHVVFSTGRIAQRESFFSWVGPYSQGELTIFGPNSIVDAVTFEELATRRIGVVRDDISLLAAQDQGFKDNLLLKGEPAEVMHLLQTNRIQFFALSQTMALYFLGAHGLEEDLKPVYSLGAVYSHFALNKQSDPEAVAQFRQAYDAYSQTAMFRQLLAEHDPAMLARLTPP